MTRDMTDGDYFILFFKILAFLTIVIVLGLFVVKPWLIPEGENVVYKCEETPKRMAQTRLLNELKDCDHKFGSDYRSLNVEYCQTMLSSLKYLIDQGHFDLTSDEAAVMVRQINSTPDIDEILARTQTKSAEVNDAMESIKNSVNEIVGDI